MHILQQGLLWSMLCVGVLHQSGGLQVLFHFSFPFPWVEWNAVVLMLGLMNLFAAAFISFTSKTWQPVKWNFSVDFLPYYLETFLTTGFLYYIALVHTLFSKHFSFSTNLKIVSRILQLDPVYSLNLISGFMCPHHVHMFVLELLPCIWQGFYLCTRCPYSPVCLGNS